jgi:hypothetical protein
MIRFVFLVVLRWLDHCSVRRAIQTGETMKFIGLASAVLSVVNTTFETSWLGGSVFELAEPVQLGLWGVALIALSVLLRRKAVSVPATQISRGAQPIGDMAGSLAGPA